ncbi:MAG TPA: hypothetical protein VIY29_09690 [Ktedonobacteraceae bacterium]
MSLTKPPSSPEELNAIEQLKPRKARRRYLQALMLVLLVIPIFVAWQLINSRLNSTDPAVAGRPLSNPRTHLHVVAFGERAGVVYLGTHYGLYTSTDGGNTWPEQRGALNTMMIMSIAVSPVNPQVLAVIARPSTGIGFQGGMYFSADGGKNWQVGGAPAGLSPSAYLFSLKAGTASGGQFYAFYEYAGWFETRDMGAHWYPMTSGALSAMQTPSLLTDAANPNHLYLGGDKGLYESRDDGRKWRQITAVSGNVLGLAASQTVPRLIFCSTEEGGLYRWHEGSSQITNVANLPMKSALVRLAVNAAGTVLYGMTGQDLWVSNDSGATWKRRWKFYRNDMVSLLVDPLNAKHLYAGFFLPAKVYYSGDGGESWQVLTE